MAPVLVCLGRIEGLWLVTGTRIDDIEDHTVQGIWEAHIKGEIAPGNVVDDVDVRAAGVLAEKGYWMWMFQAATEELTSWQDLHGDYLVVDPDNGCIWEWGTWESLLDGNPACYMS
jgi:hypothetical protein